MCRGVRPPPRVYLRSLSTQGPHPRAQQSFIDLAGYGFLWAPFARRLKVQVTGVYLAITVYKQLVVDAILVWHWPSGAINAVSIPTALSDYDSEHPDTRHTIFLAGPPPATRHFLP